MTAADAPKGDVAAPSRRVLVAALSLLVVVVIAVVAVRVRLLSIPLERDEGEYAYGGQLLLRGESMYAHLYTMKLPGTHAAYGLFMALFGETIEGVHLGYLLTNLAGVALTGLLARRLVGPVAGLAAAAMYAAVTLSPGVLGPSAHATHYVVVPALAGLVLVARAIERDSLGLAVVAGFTAGLAPIMKQAGAGFAAIGAVWLFAAELRREPRSFARAIGRTFAFGAASLVPLGATFLLVKSSGAFDTFWFWTVDYAREYASEVPLAGAVERFSRAFERVAGSATLVWALAAIGLLVPIADAASRRYWLLRTAFLVIGFAGVCPGFWFRTHYFVLMLPALVLHAALAVDWLVRLLTRRLPSVSLLPVLLIAAAAAEPVYRGREVLLRLPVRAASRKMYVVPTNPFPESVDLAAALSQIASPADTIAVIGSEPELYFYLGRTAPTGYVYTYGLYEDQAYAERMRREMAAELTAARPKYVVLLQEWGTIPASGELNGARYDLIGFVEVTPDAEPRASWFPGGKPATPRYEIVYAVLRRTD